MKYRVLTPEEMEAYKIGYKVGARELFITGQEWDSEEEHRIYRKGYNAGCKDRERKNLKPELLDKCQQCQQCQQCLTCDSQDSQDSQDHVYPIVIEKKDNSNKGGMGGKEKEENKAKAHNALEIFGNSFKATDAVVGMFDRPDGTKKEGIQIKNPRLMAFVRQRFDKQVLNKVSDWAIDHNQRGHTYNATALLKLLCKFQSNVEPTINFNHVQAEYLTFEYKGE